MAVLSDAKTTPDAGNLWLQAPLGFNPGWEPRAVTAKSDASGRFPGWTFLCEDSGRAVPESVATLPNRGFFLN